MSKNIAVLDVDAQVETSYRSCDRPVPKEVLRRAQPLMAPFCPVCLEQEWPVSGLSYWGVCATINPEATINKRIRFRKRNKSHDMARYSWEGGL